MKLLHTSDWHVGKTIRGRSRHEEHVAVLGEIVGYVTEHQVDVVMVAGDLFETASPNAESEALVYRTLLALGQSGAKVVVIAGNHDHPYRLGAVAPVLAEVGVTVVPHVRRASEGGVIEVVTASGERANIALIPFLSQRGIVRVDDLMESDATGQVQKYAARYRTIVDLLSQEMADDAINVVVAHAYVDQALSGGGERAAHMGADYAVAPSVFGSQLHYVALGHLHRPQRIAGATQIYYCGSPMALDFGEVDQDKQVNLVEAHLGVPAKVTVLPLTGGRPLRTVRGTLADVAAVAPELADCWVRVELRETARAGLADEVRELIPNAVDVSVVDPERMPAKVRESRANKSPRELFEAFCASRDHHDERVLRLFDELLGDANATPTN